jgi:hypothetical protein
MTVEKDIFMLTAVAWRFTPFKTHISLQRCKGLTDYVLLLDADMILEINSLFDKNELKCDYYKLSQGNENFYYDNIRIVTNNGNYH